MTNVQYCESVILSGAIELNILVLHFATLKNMALLNSFPTNGNTLGFCLWKQKLEKLVSQEV